MSKRWIVPKVPGHELIHDGWSPMVRVHCSCGEWSGERDPDGEKFGLTKAHAAHAVSIATGREHARLTSHRDWYRKTDHCGACGQPGAFCVCTTPCGCADYHEVGSGLAADPLDVFAETTVHADQGELFG